LREIPTHMRCHSSEMTSQPVHKNPCIPEVAMADASPAHAQQNILASPTIASRAEEEPNSMPVLWMLSTLCPEAKCVSAESPVAPALDCSRDLTEAEGVSTETPVVPALKCSRDLSKVVDTTMEALACSPELLPRGTMQAGVSTEKKADGYADAQSLPPSDSMFSTQGYGECLSRQGHSEGVAHHSATSPVDAVDTLKVSGTQAIPPDESVVMTQCYRETELFCEKGSPQGEEPDLDSSMLLTQAYSPEVQDRNTGSVDLDLLATQEYVNPSRRDEVLPTQDWRSSRSGPGGLDVRGGSVQKAGNARNNVVGRGVSANSDARSYGRRSKVAIERGVALAPFGAPVGCQAPPITVPLTQDSPGAILLGSYDPVICVQLSQSLPPPPLKGTSDICTHFDGTMSGGPSDAVEEMLTQVYTAPGVDLGLQAMDKDKVDFFPDDVGITKSGSCKSLTTGNLKVRNKSRLLPPAAMKVKRSEAPLGQQVWSSRKSLPELFEGYDFAAAPVRDVFDDSDDEQPKARRQKRGRKIDAQPALVQKQHGHPRRGNAMACSELTMASACHAGVFGGDAPTYGVASRPRRSPASKAMPKKQERVISAMAGDEQEEWAKKANVETQQQFDKAEVPASPKRKRGRPRISQTPSPTEVPAVPSLEVDDAETPSRSQGSFLKDSSWTPPKRRLHGKQRPPMPFKPTSCGSLLEKQQQDAVQNGDKAGADNASEQQCTVEAISCGTTTAAIESGESVMSPLDIFRSLLA